MTRSQIGWADPVDVYVKFVPIGATQVKAWGITQVSQLENDKDAYVSEYGPFTVSIKIWIVSRALLVLSHEFGHVKYQVPNLASYLEFHKIHYKDTGMLTFIGHSPNDPSGQSANRFGNIFKQTYANFLRTRNEKAQNPAVLLTKIKKSLGNKYSAFVKASRPIVNIMQEISHLHEQKTRDHNWKIRFGICQPVRACLKDNLRLPLSVSFAA